MDFLNGTKLAKNLIIFNITSFLVKLPEMGLFKLNTNYFRKLIKYIKDVYSIDQQLQKLTDVSVHPSYRTGKVMLPVLIGFLLRIRSFNEINYLLKEDDLGKLLLRGEKFSSIDTILDT